MDTINRRRQFLLALVGTPLLVAAPVTATAAVLGSAAPMLADTGAALTPKVLPGVPLPPRGPRGPRAPYVPGPRRVVPRGKRGPRIPRP